MEKAPFFLIFFQIQRQLFLTLSKISIREDPGLFLNSFPAPLILDEVQYVPELLPSLKRKMDQSDKKGQYFLTGSQNFSVLKTIAESMAGRVAVFHYTKLCQLS
ncbi:MAG: AAA family ATPase [Rhabdochlamydiaceae bacterium]